MFGLIIYNIFEIYNNISHIDYSSFKSVSVLYMLAVNVGSFLLILFVHFFTHFKFVINLLYDTISYMAYQGAYSQTMVIYGLCNIDDVSWGTKGAVGSSG